MRSIDVRTTPFGFLRNPDYVDARVIAANVAEQHTVPSGAAYVVFSANCDFYVAYGSNPTAAVPSNDVTDGSASELNPTSRYIVGVAKISVISATAGIITMSWYAA